MKRLIKESKVYFSKKDLIKDFDHGGLLLKNGNRVNIWYKSYGCYGGYEYKVRPFDVENYINNVVPEMWEDTKQKYPDYSKKDFMKDILEGRVSSYEYFSDKEIKWVAVESPNNFCTMEDIFEDAKYSVLKSNVIIGTSFDNVCNAVLKNRYILDNLATPFISKKDLFEKILNDGYVHLEDGKYYMIVKVNDDNFNLSEATGLKEQLVKEGLYNRTYVSIITDSLSPKWSVEMLPIWGRADKYETKWLEPDPNKVLKQEFSKSSMMGLANRVVI